MKGDETEALRARLDDLARRAGRLWTPLCSRFLTQEERSLAQRCARENGVLAAFDGGWEGAERSQCCFYPDGLEPDFTGVWLEVRLEREIRRCRSSGAAGQRHGSRHGSLPAGRHGD